MIRNDMNCAQCDDLFADYFEEALDSARAAAVEAHVMSCARCQGLVRDIDGIRGIAARLPDLAPSRDLWSGIEARIQPTVVSIARPQRSLALSQRWMAVAAASLVVVTSSVTYVATSRSLAPVTRRAAAERAAPLVRVSGATVNAPDEDPARPEGRVSVDASENLNPLPRPGSERAATAPRAALASSRPASVASPSETALAGEIGRLQTVLRQRREQLDPATVKVVETNLTIIDMAVKQARAALAGDPASRFLNEQLDNTLQKKVELLRTVAMLPSST